MSLLTPSASSSSVVHDDLANAIRALAMDAVQQANSGHPGMPMGMADVATVLFTQFLKHDPADPAWPDRDRFVLSAGHGSMLLYALLYLTGYEDITLDQIKNFRQLGSRTAGHPEYGHARGIETTTGPLGQGIATAVGMAIAERHLNARFGDELANHYTYVIAGDGCLMEGISQEAISLAGHLKLNKLIILFDDNGISIDGPVSLASSEDQGARFSAAGFFVQKIDGHDPQAIAKAIETARQSDRPSLICCRTVIGKGAPTKQGTAATHGSPLGPEEIAGARKALNWPHPPFSIPAPILSTWRTFGARAKTEAESWRKHHKVAPGGGAFDTALKGDMPAEASRAMADYKAKLLAEKPSWASRKSSQMALEVLNPHWPELLGGSADLTGSNNTKTAGLKPLTAKEYNGRYLHYGIREHGMAAAMNGMALHGGVIPYGGTFLVFTDYCRPAIRLSALMHQRVIYVMTHDSIGLGEDGPTHQPVEHLASLRAIPNVNVFRPADALETAECWEAALMARQTPSIIALSRQDLPAVRVAASNNNMAARGGYELSPATGTAKISLLATGSEIAIAIAAQKMLTAEGIGARVVSLPCFSLFDQQSDDYRAKVLGPGTKKIAIEAGIRMGWDKYIGSDGIFIGMNGFGASGPIKDLYEHFGITAEAVVAAAKRNL